MSSGYVSCFALTMTKEDIEKLKLESFNNFIAALDEYGITLDSYSAYLEDSLEDLFENNEEEFKDLDARDALMEKRGKDIDKLYDLFVDEFKKDYGAEIGISYHDSDGNGSSSDDIKGYHFYLTFEEMYELSDEANALCKLIKVSEHTGFVSRY